jgi:hypothetical protein
MDMVIFAIVLLLAIFAANRWGADSRPTIDKHDRWWPGVR